MFMPGMGMAQNQTTGAQSSVMDQQLQRRQMAENAKKRRQDLYMGIAGMLLGGGGGGGASGGAGGAAPQGQAPSGAAGIFGKLPGFLGAAGGLLPF